MKKMLVVDDHPLLAQCTKDIFINMGVADRVDICHNATDAIRRIKEENDWFRIWLDIDIPGAIGLSMIRQVCDMGFAHISAIITASRNPGWMVEVKKMGFLGYLTKAAGFDSFKFAVKQIVDGNKYYEGASQESPMGNITQRQKRILNLIALGYTSKGISRELSITPGTVDNQIAMIVDALRAKTRSHAVAIGIECGYVDASVLPNEDEMNKLI